MNNADLKKTTLTSAAQLIRKKEISPVELTEAVLNRIGELNERMRAFITVTADLAMDRARAAESGKSAGPLHGVPLSLKDLYDTAGIRTTAGMKVFRDRVPTADAEMVTKLQEAGAVIVGKTNMHEAAYGITTINPHYGTARNPWNPDYVAGGSSGGSATAIAMSMGFGSLGSDTGGSIRVPASLCGIVGFKPTYGLCSLRGVVPLSWSMDHAGPMAQTVEDVTLLLGVMAGRDFAASLTGNVKGLRIGVARPYFFDNLAPEVDNAIGAALKTYERLGAEIVDVNLTMASLQRGIWSQIACPEAFSYHEKFLATRADEYGADVRSRLEVGRLLLSIDYVRAKRARNLMKEECRKVFESVDVIVTPTVPITPPRLDQTKVQRGSVTEPTGVALTRCTRHFNITGMPAISLPCGFSSDGMPIGMQIAGREFEDSTLLRAAHAYEQDARWYERRCAM